VFAVIDLETTGGSANRDKITEIAIVVHDGVRRIREYSTLINPERPIPHYITDITGISDDMVADSPKFYEVARDVVELTEGCIFVAHNVNFDYGFLREEYQRLGFTYEREKLCTVRTSRKLIPGLPSYSLGKLCYSLGIQLRDRHRAMGDAAATVILLERLLEINPELAEMAIPHDGIGKSRPKKDPYAALPLHLDRNNLDALPSDPGVFFFHDVAGNPLFADQSSNIRKSVLKKLKDMEPVATPENGFLIGLNHICEITWELTGNELLAMLRYSDALKKQTFTIAADLRKPKYRVGVFPYHDQRDFMRLHIVKLKAGSDVLAEFPTEDDARAALTGRMRKYELCANLVGLETGSGPCSQHALGKCRGACAGLESPEEHNKRMETALRGLEYPYPRFFLLGPGRRQDEVSVICMDDGDCLGYAFLEAEHGWNNPDTVLDLLKPLAEGPESARIVRQFLPKMKGQKIVPF
jgi:DNA polymerase-3 subunit epsilon